MFSGLLVGSCQEATRHAVLKGDEVGDQRLALGIAERGAEVVATVDHVIGAFAEPDQRVDQPEYGYRYIDDLREIQEENVKDCFR